MIPKEKNIAFVKYEATGNDFILIDNREKKFKGNQALIKHLCHRRFGIGADGLILLENDDRYDFKMVYYNADGGESSMCGNGGRSIVRFAKNLGIIEENTVFRAVDGPHEAVIQDTVVHLKMTDTRIEEVGDNYTIINTGSPHYVVFLPHISDTDVKGEGAKIRYSERFFKEGININFVEVQSEHEISVRTYERGVEDETYSCGTGVTAASLVWATKEGRSPVSVHTPGGDLKVRFQYTGGNFTDVWLSGPAEPIFEGFYLISL